MGRPDFKIVIPARYASTRLPGKVLRRIAGRPMLEHVWSKAVASGAREVVIATEDERVAETARDFGAEVCMTRTDHSSGTDRIGEVAGRKGWDDASLVVNLQGDEPLMPASLVGQVADALTNDKADIATACAPIDSVEQWCDTNVVKVVRDARGFALYFSRAPIPWDRKRGRDGLPSKQALRHIGIYAYRVNAVKRLAATRPCALEICEALEQLRAQWLGLRLLVVDACETPGQGVDTAADLEVVECALSRSAAP